MNRRRFLKVAAGLTAAATVMPMFAAQARQEQMPKIRAIAFDGLVIFNPLSIVGRVDDLWPGKGPEFAAAWRNRQFEYSWLRTVGNRYVDFWQVTGEALRHAAKSLGLAMTQQQHEVLMNAYCAMPVWPDVPEALAEFRRRGIRMVFLSNFTAAMLDANLGAARLKQYFEDHLSTDRVRAYKPSPESYRMGVDQLGLSKEEIAFAAFGGWDAVGAKWFGYPTVWVNRAGAQTEELGAEPDVITGSIRGLMNFVLPRRV